MTDTATKYTVEIRDGQCNETRTIEATTLADAIEQAEAEARDWAEGGEWGNEGESVSVWYTLTDEEGDVVHRDGIMVQIEPDHDAMIAAAGGDTDCDHEWVSTVDIDGGLDSNPGVFSKGGTTFVYCSHCDSCGLRRKATEYGTQRNPGQSDKVEYTLPEEAE